eukprot:4685620-Prymnesium_polylepis.1
MPGGAFESPDERLCDVHVLEMHLVMVSQAQLQGKCHFQSQTGLPDHDAQRGAASCHQENALMPATSWIRSIGVWSSRDTCVPAVAVWDG